MKKRMISLLLVLALVVGICPAALAGEGDIAEVEAVVENYLRTAAHNMFFFGEETTDTTQSTILSLSGNHQDIVANVALPVSLSEADTEAKDYNVALKSALVGTTRKAISAVDSLELQEQRVQYYRHLKETKNITYSSFKADYTFLDTVVSGSHALVNVYEALNYQYSDCEEPSYEGQTYSIALVKTGENWIIAEVLSDDIFFFDYYGTDFNLEAVLQDYDAACAVKEEPFEAPDYVVAEPMATTTNISYQKDNAINYALTYSSSYDDGGSDKPDASNPNFYWYTANCMNFVSQCIWAGFGGSNSKEDIKNHYGMDCEGTTANQWYTDGTGLANHYSASWAGVVSWKKYIDGKVNGEVGINAGTATIRYDANTFPYSAETLKGSMLLIRGRTEDGSTMEFGHAVFVNGATGNTRDKIFVTGNNNNWKNKRLDELCRTTLKHENNNIYLVIPTTFTTNASSSDLRLWADLHNALPSGTTATLKGRANQKAYGWSMEITKPSGLTLYKSNLGDGSTVSTTYTFSEKGFWTIVLKAKDAAGTQKTFTFTVRIY